MTQHFDYDLDGRQISSYAKGGTLTTATSSTAYPAPDDILPDAALVTQSVAKNGLQVSHSEIKTKKYGLADTATEYPAGKMFGG